MTRQPLKPISPGELLFHEFLVQMDFSGPRLARDINLPSRRLGDVLAGRAVITPDLDHRLCRYFGLTEGYWLRAQALYDAEVATMQTNVRQDGRSA